MDDDKNALLESCRIIGRKLHINFTEPLNRGWFTGKNPVGEIAHAAKIKYRQVSLNDRWWQFDCGPLLGFKKDGTPVVLLPSSPAGYTAYDSLQHITEKVTADFREKLEPFAYVFYRPFAAHKIKLTRLIDYAARTGIEKDVKRLLLAGLGGALCGAVLPVLAGYFFDHIIQVGNRALFLRLLLIFTALSLSLALFKSVGLTVFLRLETRLEAALQGAVWDRLLNLPSSFFRRFPAEELADRSMNISKIRSMIAGTVSNSLVSAPYLVCYLALLFCYHARTGILALAFMVVAAPVVLGVSRLHIKYQKTAMSYFVKATQLRTQWTERMTKLRMAGAEERAFQLWETVFDKKKKIDYKNDMLQNIIHVFHVVWFAASYGAFFYTTAHDSYLTTGKWIAVFIAFTMFMTTLLHLMQAIPLLTAVMPLYERGKPILEICPELDHEKIPPGVLDGSIVLDKVSFRYQTQGAYIIKDVTCTIKSGEYIGIVGPSGSGKSTLLRLLMGFEKAESGQIYYSGRDLASLDILGVRQQLGVVLQNSRLLPGDIFYNITGGEVGLSLDDAWAAAKLAGLDEELKKMPMGMHTIVVEEAGTLSGGQKQRILIARALVKNPKILLFDEATSALDNQSQEMIQKTLEEMKITRIVVAHRFSTVKNCHRILVLDQGKILEEGTFSELMRRNGIFAGFAARQSL
ncbi:MAG: NHLP bacteriocin export ABC transporter permease/ATPase subunit [Bacillota bacterium]